MKKLIGILAVMLLLTGCSAENGIGFSAVKANSPTPEIVEVESFTPTPEVTPVQTPTPSPTPSPTPRLYGRLSTMTLKESTDELIKLGADITNIVEYDEAAAAKSASGKLKAYTQRIDFTLNGKHDCIVEAFASVDAATGLALARPITAATASWRGAGTGTFSPRRARSSSICILRRR